MKTLKELEDNLFLLHPESSGWAIYNSSECVYVVTDCMAMAEPDYNKIWSKIKAYLPAKFAEYEEWREILTHDTEEGLIITPFVSVYDRAPLVKKLKETDNDVFFVDGINFYI
jgi:hypothetical protein